MRGVFVTGLQARDEIAFRRSRRFDGRHERSIPLGCNPRFIGR
jgi:hypothetical protein